MSMEHMEDPVLEELNNKETSSLLWALDYNAEYPVPTAASPIANKHVVESHQSSLALPTPNGTLRTPRTANRVRFEIQEGPNDERSPNKIAAEDEAYLEEEDYVSRSTSTEGRRSSSQRAPLLSEVEAPSVTVATTEFEFNTEDLLESARPKSGMGSAFMNMANSIMYASCPTPAGGIIGNRLMVLQWSWHHRCETIILSRVDLAKGRDQGQPYAFRQAGLTVGIILLLVLTLAVNPSVLSAQKSFSELRSRLIGRFSSLSSIPNSVVLIRSKPRWGTALENPDI